MIKYTIKFTHFVTFYVAAIQNFIKIEQNKTIFTNRLIIFFAIFDSLTSIPFVTFITI